ncbi:gliding motility-associated C-terminal domain-containing protein [Flavobacterium amniphilum]|uniref:T9SS type B sorting domain-containing protein n=1 Tax=Flavobacterium amniphilum TaxID=1834035 RepID=UPI00202A8F18|nr:gliding motility-associated C-terminal domain-containing protein [Flavobacterium amniphilum]MCL9804143.1 gliding motility-associated C-terminal domain-containing protein [Flavobacterium amniphilum]
MKRTIPFKLRLFLALIVPFFIHDGAFAQISAPTYAFTKICASPGFNTYTVNFSFTGPNTYTLKMSDASGNFANPTGITILSSQTTTSPGSFTFAVPTTALMRGEGFKLRVVGSSPAINGSMSAAFPAYYQPYDQEFWLNGKVMSIPMCSGSTVTLSIDAAAPSPVSIPNIVYRWYRNGVQIASGPSTSLVVNSPGDYQCFIDYGSCSTFDVGQIEKSQVITVNNQTNTSFTLVSSIDPPNDICPSNPTILSTTPGYSYKWFRNDIEIAGATANSYSTAVTGSYKVEVDQGSCSPKLFTNSIQVNALDFDINFPALQSPDTNIIQENETFTVTVTTTASNPTYEWYNPGGLTPINTTDTFSTNLPIAGEYKLVVKQTTGCQFPKQIFFKVKIGVNPTKIPNTISPNNDGTNDLWEIPQEYLTTEHEILITNAFGKEVLKVKNYQNDWPQNEIEFKSVNPIFYYVISKGGSPVKKGSITVIK